MAIPIPTYDELLNAILTDYVNQFPGADTAKGSLIYVKSAALASAFWGLYRYQKYAIDQIFPDTSDAENLEHHAFIRGLTKKTGETDPELLGRLLNYIRRPPAGGNANDYEQWAKSVPGVVATYCIPLGQGPGTVDVVIVADAGTYDTEIPSPELLATVKDFIDTVRPVTASVIRCLPIEILPVDIAVAVTGSDADRPKIAADLTSYLNALTPGQDFYLAQIINIAVLNGANTVAITAPAATVAAGPAQVLRPGVIDVT